MLKQLLSLALLASACAFAQQCNQRAPITATASGATVIVPATGGQSAHLCKVSFSSSAAVDIKFQAVGASTTDLTGAYKNVSTMALDFGGDLVTGAGNALAINLSGTATLGGFVSYYLAER